MKQIVTVLLALLFSSVADSREIKLASEEWPPYSYTENGDVTGFCTEVIRAVMSKIGASPVINTYPWPRAEKMALGGEVDGLYSASHKAEREKSCYYPEEKLFDSKYVFFILKKNESRYTYNGYEDLRGKTVGVTQGYTYNDELWNFLKSNKNYQEAPDDETNFRLLIKGRVDYFPAEKGNGLALIKKLKIEQDVIYIDKPIVRKPYYLIFNRNSVDEQFVRQFSSELRAFKSTPEFQALQEKYFQ